MKSTGLSALVSLVLALIGLWMAVMVTSVFYWLIF